MNQGGYLRKARFIHAGAVTGPIRALPEAGRSPAAYAHNA